MTHFPATEPPPGPGRPRRTKPPGGVVWYARPAGGQTWSSLRRSWNERYPDRGEDGTDWKCTQPQNFARDAQDVLQRLLDPRWGLKAPPTRFEDLSAGPARETPVYVGVPGSGAHQGQRP